MFASPSRHLPLELHRPIVERISDRADLYTLTLVCRALQFEADRILFRRISVRKSSSETVRRYKALIALAPRIGTHIRELEVVRYGETSSLYAMIRLLRAVLLSAPNLQRLHAVYKWGDSDWPLEIPGGLMVRGMELNQLQYFSCPWVIDHDVISFFERHPNLHDLVVFLPWGEYPISGTALPRLKYLSAWRNTATRLLPGRPVTHFQVNVWDRSHWDAEFSAALLSTSVPLRALQVPSFRWGPHLNNLLPLFSNLHYLGICQLNGERVSNISI
ncbi:hypothetical protein BOTBODRAFT_44792 [Botryobasidium botryosum FD-172 SS1]|uniref:F-box domain-containing protein n=1 Tax=Botryobasidium botryosum (strain FD-172 SS1) TaxID=930990 RepID=A0A067MF04_BOTB1|nr:hypothetical protein BOTBODRAFT_44792 [Botryobasidium botryosum FD-172 SS1]